MQPASSAPYPDSRALVGRQTGVSHIPERPRALEPWNPTFRKARNVGHPAKLLFWSVTDGSNGQVLPPASFNQTVGSSPLNITAWYFPISGPGQWGGPGSAIIDDAFSANLGRFIDDTFVDVTSDPTLTNDGRVAHTN